MSPHEIHASGILLILPPREAGAPRFSSQITHPHTNKSASTRYHHCRANPPRQHPPQPRNSRDTNPRASIFTAQLRDTRLFSAAPTFSYEPPRATGRFTRKPSPISRQAYRLPQKDSPPSTSTRLIINKRDNAYPRPPKWYYTLAEDIRLVCFAQLPANNLASQGGDIGARLIIDMRLA